MKNTISDRSAGVAKDLLISKSFMDGSKRAELFFIPMPEYGHVFVKDKYRKLGIGKVMLFRSLDYAKQIRAKSVRLSCADESNNPRFYNYSKVGFKISGEKWVQNMRLEMM